MSQVPVPQDSRTTLTVPMRNRYAAPDAEELPLPQLWGIVRRHLVLIGLITTVMVALAVAYVMTATPVYEADTTLRIDDKQKTNLPEVFVALSGGEVLTEVEVLKSRSLVEDATRQLGLQLVVQKPERVSRDYLFSRVSISPGVVRGRYILTRQPNGRFTLAGPPGFPPQDDLVPGGAVDLNGLGLVIGPSAVRYEVVEFAVLGLEKAVQRVQRAVDVTQANHEAKVATLSYKDADPLLVARVPNLIAERFIVRRQDAQKAAARSTVAFLRTQLDTLAVQLNTSEQALAQYREREQVVNPTIEGSSQVDRMIKLQAERSAVEAERAALASLLQDVQVNASGTTPGTSPYRRLLAFPTLLRNQASTELLQNLAQVEDQRAQLLVRRTPSDPDVQALDTRVHEIEEQLRSVAATYLQGLTNQVSSMDTEIASFGRQLSRVPRRELEFARLQRQPKVLEDMYSLLQTRLKEAEIAQAVEDASVQVVDRAVPPLAPVSPHKGLTVVAALILGLLIGVGVAFVIEYLDKSVHSRSDVTDATGLPVLGLIPRIPRPGKKVALISERRDVVRESLSPPPKPPAPPKGNSMRRDYTFLIGPDSSKYHIPDGEPPQTPELPTPPSALPRRVQQMAITGIGTAIAEAYGSLQTNLLHSRADQPVQTIVFTSSQPGEGKTTSVVNLALSLTHRGGSVLLIDADLRRGTVHGVFDVPRSPGFADVVKGAVRFEDACRNIRVQDGGTLHYLTSGTLPNNPSAMLASQELRVLLDSLRGQFETIIIDSPPVNMMTDAALLGSSADGVVIVARAGVTHSAALGYAMEQLGHVRARVLGVVLNDIDFRRDATYDPAYRYYDYGQYSTPSPS